MTTRVVTYDEVKAALLALPKAGRNEACLYTWRIDGEVGHCAAGQALIDLGLPCPDPGEDGEHYDGLNVTSLNGPDRAVWEWLAGKGVTFTPDAERLLGDVQYVLDTEAANTWGAAVASALDSAVRS